MKTIVVALAVMSLGGTDPSVSIHPDRTTVLTMATEPSWSPDSKKIVFSSGKFPEGREIFTMNADGSALQQLTQNSFADEYPMWSPGGKEILFSTNREGAWKLYLINADGSEPRSLSIETSRDPNDPCRTAWSPDGKRFVYPVTKDGKRELFVANASGANATRLIATNGLYPSWSPDGRSIAWVNSDERNIYVTGADGTSPRRLMDPYEKPNGAYYPSWAPDGKRVYYVERVGEQSEVFSIAVDGSDRRRVTSAPGRKYYAMASPVGSRVIFVTYDSERKTDTLTLVNVDGSGLKPLN